MANLRLYTAPNSLLLGLQAMSWMGHSLFEGDMAIKITSYTNKIYGRLSIAAHVGVVDLGLGDDRSLNSEIVPLDLGTISLEKGL